MFSAGDLAVRTRFYVKRSPWLYRVAKRLTGRGAADHLCDRHTELCIEGYPSSGNSFSFAVLRLANPRLRIAHHCHSVANLEIALTHGIPAVCLIRNPADAIASRLARFGGNPRDAVAEYVDFYEFAAVRRDRLTIVTFEEVTRRTRDFLARLERECGVELPVADMGALEQAARDYMTRWSARRGVSDRVSLPVAERERAKQRLVAAIRAAPDFAKAEALWRWLGSAPADGAGYNALQTSTDKFHGLEVPGRKAQLP